MKNKLVLVTICCSLLFSSPVYPMNTVKGWINAIVPGTFETEDSASLSSEQEAVTRSFSEAEAKVLTALANREEELKKKEAIHAQKAAELKSLEQQIDQKVDQMKRLTAEFEKKRQLRKEMDERDISKIVRLYEIMDPELSAEKLNNTDLVTATHIILRMNQRKAAAILELMDTEVAVEITEMVTRFKEDRTEVAQN